MLKEIVMSAGENAAISLAVLIGSAAAAVFGFRLLDVLKRDRG
jgi:Na+/H+ antiporter NhaA